MVTHRPPAPNFVVGAGGSDTRRRDLGGLVLVAERELVEVGGRSVLREVDGGLDTLVDDERVTVQRRRALARASAA